jgi:toxin FitB
MFLLDTNVLSELRKAKTGRIDRRVAAWAREQDADTMFLSVVTLMEIEAGVLRIGRRDPKQAAVLRAWINDSVHPEFAGRIFAIDANVARRCAPLHVPDPRPDRDAWIAATALLHGLTVVTRNVKDFEPMGVPVLNPWEA